MADDDIIVVGKLRPTNPGVFVSYGRGLYGYKSTERNIGKTGTPERVEEGDIIVVGRASDPANATRLKAAMDNVAKTVAILTPIIRALSATKEYTLNSGEKVTGAEIKRLWGLIRFFVTDQPFGQNRDGSVQLIDGKLVDSLYFAAFEGADSYADPNYQNNAGMNFIIMHEVMHMTSASQTHYDDAYTTFRETVPQPNETKWFANTGGWFGRTERFTNTLAKVFGDQQGFTPVTSPTFGYIPGN
ncbi:hypothetical protein ASG29_01215 [Sphingomonas sp. Leaf412]|uniref:hypothetical protein n=1 Tax=Sphingomonas sp. Leaf412 TaxID=1736370 RepID=UPI0006F2BF8B|nr:hypothetical protein [Sphingomonas sp. Leaf412]KQT34809.1 hypothetical protein ASG29_01215 [Sphingomonas sp. Leaf412]